jgi:hypothetical protein
VVETRALRRIFGPRRLESRENCIIKIFIIVLFARYYWGDRYRMSEMSGPYNTNGENDECT